jgi:hypothetical protein
MEKAGLAATTDDFLHITQVSVTSTNSEDEHHRGTELSLAMEKKGETVM